MEGTHPRSLTARPWKMMLGRRSFPFRMVYFPGALLNFQGLSFLTTGIPSVLLSEFSRYFSAPSMISGEKYLGPVAGSASAGFPDQMAAKPSIFLAKSEIAKKSREGCNYIWNILYHLYVSLMYDIISYNSAYCLTTSTHHFHLYVIYLSAFSGTPTPSLNCSTLVKIATCDSNINVLHIYILYNHLSGFLVLTCAKKPPDSVLPCPTLVTTLYTTSSLLAYTIQGGPLLVITGVSTPINNTINGFSWGY